MSDTKTCTKCATTKPLPEFSKFRHSPDGLAYWCKPCARAYNAEYRNRPDRREKARQTSADWRAEDPDRARASEAAYKAANPHVWWVSSYKCRAHQYGVPIVIEPFTKADVIDRYGDACHWCGGPFEEIDHHPAVALGGTHTIDGVRPSCTPCNRAGTGVRSRKAERP